MSEFGETNIYGEAKRLILAGFILLLLLLLLFLILLLVLLLLNNNNNNEEVGRGCGDWMELAQDMDRWRALVSTVMNFGVVP